jgi:hypothetical protein
MSRIFMFLSDEIMINVVSWGDRENMAVGYFKMLSQVFASKTEKRVKNLNWSMVHSWDL